MKRRALLLTPNDNAITGRVRHVLRGEVAFQDFSPTVSSEKRFLEDDLVAIIDVGLPDLSASASHARWGLAAARSLRLQSQRFIGPIILLSFEREEDLVRSPGGAILNTPGISFLRLPVTAQELVDAIASAPSLGLTQLNESLPPLRREAAPEMRERMLELRHRLVGVLTSVLAAARGIARFHDTHAVNSRVLATPLATLAAAWRALDHRRLAAVTSEVDGLLAEAANLGIIQEPVLESRFQARADEALTALRWIVEHPSDAAPSEPAYVSRVLDAAKSGLGQLEAMLALMLAFPVSAKS